jgi:AcrR family transcriptional regulator
MARRPAPERLSGTERRRRPARERLSGGERRRRILAAAAEVFAAAGYRAASMEDVARAAGVTKPVVYDHFGSKRELFVEVMERARDELTGLGARAMSADAPARERVRAAIEAFFAYVEANPAPARVLLFAARGEPELSEAFGAVQEEATARLAALLSAEPELAPAANLPLVTEFLKSGLHGLAEWWIEHPATPRDVLVDAVMDAAWAGLRSRYQRR